MKVKKNLSIGSELLERAEDRAKKLSTTFAGYVTMLINADLGLNYVMPEKKQSDVQKLDDEVFDKVCAIMEDM